MWHFRREKLVKKRNWPGLCLAGGLVILWAVLFGCVVYQLLGIPCPGCGMTRAWLSLLRGDFAGAFRAHPLFWTLPFMGFWFLFADRVPQKAAAALTVLACVLFAGVYIVRMVLYFPHEEPMTVNSSAPLIRILKALHILA